MEIKPVSGSAIFAGLVLGLVLGAPLQLRVTFWATARLFGQTGLTHDLLGKAEKPDTCYTAVYLRTSHLRSNEPAKPLAKNFASFMDTQYPLSRFPLPPAAFLTSLLIVAFNVATYFLSTLAQALIRNRMDNGDYRCRPQRR